MAVAVCVRISTATADEVSEPPFVSVLLEVVRTELRAASIERAPPLVPPKPVVVRWKPRMIGSFDLGDAVLSMVAADIDNDGVDELIALTSHDLQVVRLQLGAGSVQTTQRLSLTARAAKIRPRDSVAAMVFVRASQGFGQLYVRTSYHEHGQRFRWDGSALAVVGEIVGFPVCGSSSAELHVGRNYFEVGSVRWGEKRQQPKFPSMMYGIRCHDGFVDKVGRPLMAASAVGINSRLVVRTYTTCRQRDEQCQANNSTQHVLRNAGTAFVTSDINGDGELEAIYSSAAPPGSRDRVTVVRLNRKLRSWFRHEFATGDNRYCCR